MKKILILGANGFSGKHQLDFLIQHQLLDDYEIIAIDKTISTGYPGIRWIQSDLLKKNSIENILIQEKPDYIINFVGIFSFNNFNELFECTVMIPQRIFQTIQKHALKIQKILLIGSAAEYGNVLHVPVKESTIGNPISLYGLNKIYQTQLALYYFNQFKIPFVLARTFNVLGKGLSTTLSIGSFQKQIEEAKNNDCIYVGNINTKRDFLGIEQVVQYYWQLLLYGTPGEIYNVCSGKSVTIRSILESLIKKSDKKLSIKIDQNRIKKADINDIYGDNSKLLNLLKNSEPL